MDVARIADVVGRWYRKIPNRTPGKRRFARMVLQPIFRRQGLTPTMILRSGSQFCGPIDDWIPWQIFLHGCYWVERDVEPQLLATAKQSSVVFDVGAHMGYYTVQFAAQSPGKIHSFEPNPKSYHFLRHNVDLNGLSNVTLNQAGVSSQPGRLTLHIPNTGRNSGNASLSTVTQSNHSDCVDVEVLSLSAYCDRQRIDRIDMIKMDVEGHEFEALKGMSDLFAQRRVWRLFAEWNATTAAGSGCDNLFHQMEQFGYSAWTIEGGLIKPFNHQHSSLVMFEVRERNAIRSAA